MKTLSKFLITFLIITILFLSYHHTLEAQTPPLSCTITGLVINPQSDQAYPNGIIYLSTNTLPLQIIGGTVIQPLQFTIKTDNNGNINPPLTLPQSLKVCIGIGGPAFPGILVQIPATSTADFGTILSTDIVAANPNPCIINSNFIVVPVF